jgi:hypothetical protein
MILRFLECALFQVYSSQIQVLNVFGKDKQSWLDEYCIFSFQDKEHPASLQEPAVNVSYHQITFPSARYPYRRPFQILAGR